tara:strand:- start:347 stop:1006 length:660 start_codon:yes stop_codon:yes gene_type:complete
MQTIFLDFDGTLVDSSKGIYKAFKDSCEIYNIKTPEYNIFKTKIGPPIQSILESLYPNIDNETKKLIVQKFRYSYDNYNYSNLVWYKNVIETLKILRTSRKIQLIIVTNKPTKTTEKIVINKKLTNLFSFIIGIDYKYLQNGDLFYNKTEALNFALDISAVHVDKAIYIGDTYSDKIAAESVGLKFIAAIYGYENWNNMNDIYLLEEFADLPNLLDSII